MKVKEIMLGDTKVEFYDDYIVKTKEEKDAIIERARRIVVGSLTKQKQKAETA